MPSNTQKTIEQQVLALLGNIKSGLSAKELSGELKIRKKNYHHFRKALNYLRTSRQIFKLSGTKKYNISTGDRIVQGELRMTKSGFGFVQDEKNNVDIYIGRDHLNTAFDMDQVEVKLYARSQGKNEDGYVSKIIKRNRNFFVGTFHQTQYYGFVVPDDPKIYRDFFLPKEKQKGAKEGDKVVVILEKWDSDHLNPEGSVLEIIGQTGDPGVDVASVAYSFQLGINFPEVVNQQVKTIPGKIPQEEIAKRKDLRDMICFTIDPEDARDFDDAVSLNKTTDGNWELGVHIADVSFYVPENTAVDKEALKRATSVYLVDRVIPMLPEKLSNELCSLQPKKDRLTMSCIMKISPEGDLLGYEIHPSIINSNKRYTYEEAQQIVDGHQSDSRQQVLKDMMELSKVFTRQRISAGGIDFETPEVSFDLDESGFPTAIIRKDRLDSHRLVEEFMLMANKVVAQHVKNISNGKKLHPFVYRIHAKPDPEKMKKFFDFLHALGYKIKSDHKITSAFFQKIINDIKGTKEEMIIEEVALRSMMKAVYSTTNVGHFGLGFTDYTHFTSPIRRYPDLTVHRLLKLYHSIKPGDSPATSIKSLDKICEQSTKMERTALEAERESIRLKKNEYISKHIGDEYDGIISGVTSFGIFVELLETLVEGLVHVKDLEGYYIYDEKTYRLISSDTGQSLRLGDSVRIIVNKVNLESGKVDFKLVDKNS